VHQELLEPQDCQAHKDKLDPLEVPDQLDKRVAKVPQVFKDRQENQDLLESGENKVQQDLQEHRVNLVIEEQEVPQD